jgi:putative transposase
MRWRVKDLISELHNKTALFFVSNFDVIFLPDFETKQMASKKTRNIKSKSVRSMLTFAHFKFRQFLNFKAAQYEKRIITANEAYTSKTCSWNGVIKNIGGGKIIKDKDVVVDRDYNGARGIFLRALAESPFQRKSKSNESDIPTLIAIP